MPTELDELQRKIMQMEIEEAALKKETDRPSKERLEHSAARSWPSCVISSTARRRSGTMRRIP